MHLYLCEKIYAKDVYKTIVNYISMNAIHCNIIAISNTTQNEMKICQSL